MESIKAKVYLFIIIFSVVTECLVFIAINSMFSLYAVGMMVWVSVPWIYVALIAALTKHKSKLIALLVAAVIAGAFGVGVIIDAFYFHIDAQSGLVFIFIPLWQLIFLVAISPLLLLFKKAHP